MLTKILLKMVLIAGIAAGAMAWLATSQGKSPGAYFSALSLQMPTGISVPDLDVPALPRLGSQAPATVYRWTDTSGVVNLSTSPPPAGTPFTHERVDPNANLIPAVQPAASQSHSGTAKSARKTRQTESLPVIPQLTDLRERLDAVQSAHDQRTEHLNNQLQGQLD